MVFGGWPGLKFKIDTLDTQIVFEAGDDTLSKAVHFRYLCRIPGMTHPFFVPKLNAVEVQKVSFAY